MIIAGNGLWIFPRNYDDAINPGHADAHVARKPQRAYSPAHGHRLRANATGSAPVSSYMGTAIVAEQRGSIDSSSSSIVGATL
jgi:hypothetical protein